MESAAAPPPENPLIESILFCLDRVRTIVIVASDGNACTATFQPTRRDAIYKGVEIYLNLLLSNPPQQYQIQQFAQRVARGSIPGQRTVSRLLEHAKDKELKPETFIQWIKEALEYKYPL